ncbi:hypothetical protein LCGC14_2725740, partial [marine sediment metagenome]
GWTASRTGRYTRYQTRWASTRRSRNASARTVATGRTGRGLTSAHWQAYTISMELQELKLYHGGATGYKHDFIFATPVRRIAEGYALLSCYFHRKMGARTKAIVETGTGLVGWLDDVHALSYLMTEWNVLATAEVKAVSIPSSEDVHITSFCVDTGCQRYFTSHRIGEAKLEFVYCLCDRASNLRLSGA